MPKLGGSGLIPGRGSSLYGKSSATSSVLHDNPNALYGARLMEAPPQVVDFFTSWIDSLNADVETKLDSLNEEETKPSPPIIDWVEESEDELPF